MDYKKSSKKNSNIWKRKPLLQKIYFNYFKKINKYLIDGITLEIGSGNGNIKKSIKNCITSDLFKGKNIDIVQSIYDLKFETSSVDNIILIDVFHHVEFSGMALIEMSRVLNKNGKIIMLEPAMGLFPRVIYRLFHKEPNGFKTLINWDKNVTNNKLNDHYFAAQSIPWRVFYSEKNSNKLEGFNLKIEKIKLFSDFTYLLSGGYSYKSMYPSLFYKFIMKVDKFLTVIGKKYFSARMIIILKKT